MQNHGQIASAFAAWQRAHQRLCEAEVRLEAATLAHREGLAPRPDALSREVVSLRAEQAWRYDEAADTLRRKNTSTVADTPVRGPLPGGPAIQPA